MIRSILNFFWKPKPFDLIKFHVLENQYRGIIGWAETYRETKYPTGVYTTPVRGEDNWNRQGEFK